MSSVAATSADFTAYWDALDAELLFHCARGTLRASTRGTGSPLRLFGFKADAMTPADDDQLAVAKAIALRMHT